MAHVTTTSNSRAEGVEYSTAGLALGRIGRIKRQHERNLRAKRR